MADSTLRGSLELNNLDDYNAVKFEARQDPIYELLVPQVHDLNLDLVEKVEEVKKVKSHNVCRNSTKDHFRTLNIPTSLKVNKASVLGLNFYEFLNRYILTFTKVVKPNSKVL